MMALLLAGSWSNIIPAREISQPSNYGFELLAPISILKRAIILQGLKMSDDILIQSKLDLSFLSSFKRPKVDYFKKNDPSLLEAYKSGIYDASVNFISKEHLKITGTSQTIDDVKKFLRQASFNSELILKDNKGDLLKTMPDQERLADSWFKEKNNSPHYTQLILMIPNDNDRNKLSSIVQNFFLKTFCNSKYVYVEHTDTNIYHYHIIIDKSFEDDLLSKLRADFINACIEHNARLV